MICRLLGHKYHLLGWSGATADLLCMRCGRLLMVKMEMPKRAFPKQVAS